MHIFISHDGQYSMSYHIAQLAFLDTDTFTFLAMKLITTTSPFFGFPNVDVLDRRGFNIVLSVLYIKFFYILFISSGMLGLKSNFINNFSCCIIKFLLFV